MDCNSSEEFDLALDNATKNWWHLHENGDKLSSYFQKEQADVIRYRCEVVVQCLGQVFHRKCTPGTEVNA